MEYVSIGLLILVSYLIVYSIVNRICKCVEQYISIKTFGKILSKGANINDLIYFISLINRKK